MIDLLAYVLAWLMVIGGTIAAAYFLYEYLAKKNRK